MARDWTRAYVEESAPRGGSGSRGRSPGSASPLLDEPLGSLDVALKGELCDLFAAVFAERKVPVVYVTHDTREAARLSQRGGVLEGGRISQEGTLVELESAPAAAFARAFARAARGHDA